jgi:23S rRNA (guanine745-N1)-methyltransferase
MLADVVPFLTCPACGAALRQHDGALRCAAGHSFDVARQGYVNLLTGNARAGTADTAAMVLARDAFLAGGHYAPLARRIADLAAAAITGGLIVDAGGGTGAFLAAVLERIPAATGLVVDVSKHALRRAARVSPRAAAVAWDVWRPLPVRSGAAALVLDVLAPRNGAEFRRILAGDGALLVVSPTPRHLAELVGVLGMISVDARKDERLESSLSTFFGLEARETLDIELRLSAVEAETVVQMGPSARHVDAEALRRRVAALAPPLRATASFALSLYRPIT